MLNTKEIASIIAITLILGVTISLIKTFEIFLYTLLAVFIILMINLLAKKIASFYLGTEIETKIWEIKRYGFKPKKHFKKPFPAGAFLPIIITAFSFGNLLWLASLVFDIKPKVYRKARRHGLYTFSEMSEDHIGLIAAAGIVTNLVFAVLGYLIGFSEFAKLNIYYAFFNMLPLSDLDGNKIFFGSIVLWSFLAALVLVGLGYVFFLT
jgi:Zn-dependent protease